MIRGLGTAWMKTRRATGWLAARMFIWKSPGGNFVHYRIEADCPGMQLLNPCLRLGGYPLELPRHLRCKLQSQSHHLPTQPAAAAPATASAPSLLILSLYLPAPPPSVRPPA